MNFKRHLSIFFSILIIAVSCCILSTDAYARKSSRKSHTTQTTSKKGSKKGSKKKRGNSDSKSSKKSKKSKGKSSTRKSTRVKTPAPVAETPSNDSLTLAVNKAVLDWVPSNHNPGGLRVNSVKPDDRAKNTKVSLNENFTYLPITQDYINDLKHVVKKALPDSIQNYGISLNVGRHALSYYINKIDKLPEKYRTNPSFVKTTDQWSNYSKGMDNDYIALWHSHGRYFRPGANAWMWQRPVLFQTLEDIYTMSYILPYVVPMLENAGAYVFLPRERDTNKHEVIVDNDTNEGGELYSQPYYKEKTGDKAWATGEEEGFIYDLKDFRDTENPFENGTYRQVQTIKKGKGKTSIAAWYADLPAEGEYAVYVSYKTIDNSTTDAHYTVNYSGGSKEFIVNQTMGGGTWIYLGTFPFKAGYSDTEAIVTLTNETDEVAGTFVTADAIKIGGGMGNISRSARRSDIYYDPSTPEKDLSQASIDEDDEDDADDEDDDDEGDDEDDEDNGDATDEETPIAPQAEKTKPGKAPSFKMSGLPRFLEGARYWLHWAGFPEYIYSPYHGNDDYKDDYTCRGHWVNYLAGGSRVLPKKEGLNIPIDLSMALHSDAGKRSDDSFVGTLGIYYTNDGASYTDGTPRMNSRMFTDIVMRQITGDIRNVYEPKWTRRSMWDKSYLESRVAEVPTTLIELMSHQNFADMMYGLDPNFRFLVGRAIYKGMARFLAERKGRELIIQPLSVKEFAITKERSKGEYKLSWQPTPDPLEPTAMPNKYIILERTEGNLGFHKIGETKDTNFSVKVKDNLIHSFKVVASNEGGVSFDSEVLALRNSSETNTTVLIVNGFTRISAPAVIKESGRAGFDAENDFGVPYIKDISFSGYQQNFSRSSGDNFGASSSNYVSTVIAGNTFDFVAEHGVSLSKAGFGFISSSIGAVESGKINLTDYAMVDLILGKQKATTVGNGKSGVKHRTFSETVQNNIEEYLSKGGRLFVSGQYLASDIYKDSPRFIEQVLGVTPYRASSRPSTPRAVPTDDGMRLGLGQRNYTYNNTLCEDIYVVENPDILQPSESTSSTALLTLSDNSSAVSRYSKFKKGSVITMSIPFETIRGEQQRNQLMQDILNVFDLR